MKLELFNLLLISKKQYDEILLKSYDTTTIYNIMHYTQHISE